MIRNVHITLGDYFLGESECVYRVGFMQLNKDCSQKISLEVISNDKSFTFGLSNKRDYKYSFMKKDSSSKVDYQRSYLFIDIKMIANLSQFSYQFIQDGERVGKVFHFQSSVYQQKDFKVALFGDHDLKVGTETMEYASKQNQDLLILLGDYAYDLQDENGERGDQYFKEMENLLTRQPSFLIPGNHDLVDNFNLLNARFQYPGTKNPEDNNLIYFVIGDVAFVGVNFDWYISNKALKQEYLSSLQRKLERVKNVKYKIMLNHRGMFCLRNPKIMKDAECWLNTWIFKEIEDLMIKYGFDMFLAAHDHQYMRFKPMQNYALQGHKYLQVIAGMGGTSHYFDKMTNPDNEFKETEFSEKKAVMFMNFEKNIFDFKVISVQDELMDWFQYPTNNRVKREQFFTLIDYVGIVGSVLVLMILFYSCLSYFFKKRKLTQMENELESIKPRKSDFIVRTSDDSFQ